MKSKTMFIFAGVLFLLSGLFCLFNPMAGSLAAELIAGWSFLLIGLLQMMAAFREPAWRARIWPLLLGLVAGAVGIALLADPLSGLVTLTMLVGGMFVLTGIVKLVAGGGMPSGRLKWAVILSGAVSVVLGGMILANLPGSAVVALGVLLGVELISDGVALLALVWVAGRLEGRG